VSGEIVLCDIRKEEDRKKVESLIVDKISKCKDIYQLYSLVRSSYKMTWYSLVREYLSEKDKAELLADAWVRQENPNDDVNVSRRDSIRFFKSCNKKYLMSKEDFEYYESLPDKMYVYRGVSKGRVRYGLSWTDDFEKAKWFMNRFGGGYMLKAFVNKDWILGYFNSRDESEVLLDVYKAKNNNSIEEILVEC
jgi:hypothetical protein